MNKVQYIKLLHLRGVSELKGKSIGQAVRDTGGEPSIDEMVHVNELSMTHFIEKLKEQENANKKLRLENERLSKRDEWLYWLEAAGVDNWEGYSVAYDMREEEEN